MSFRNFLIIGQWPTISEEKSMSTTLYNKIPLGRGPLLGSHKMHAAVALGVLAGAGLVWAAVRALR
jgi:hypothetical protein